jgi:hypothetical protein
MTHRTFTFEQIAETFVYEPDSGRLSRWLRNGELREVSPTCELEERFMPSLIWFRGYKIAITHISFMLMEHRWPLPGYYIDHKNGDVFDNRWTNLRELTPTQSQWNTQKRGRWVGGDDLERGVHWNGRRYQVQFRVNGAPIYLGVFVDKETANAVARKAIQEIQGEYSAAASRRRAPRPFLRRA